MPQIKLNERERFFYKHAGWSFDPKTETSRDGRVRTAVLLANAEKELQASTAQVIWEDDPLPYEGDVEWDGPVYVAVISDGEGETLGSLGGIAMASLDEPYRRVIEAELAYEYL
jgi:hypothetical protein